MIVIIMRSRAGPSTRSQTSRSSYRALACAAMISNSAKLYHTPMLSHTALLVADAVLDPITGQEQTY